jgi:hypothetical protein
LCELIQEKKDGTQKGVGEELVKQQSIRRKPTNQPTLLEAVFCNEDDQLVQLLSPDSGVVHTRASIVNRLEKLRAAMKDIGDYKTKHPGGRLNRSI